ncbi:hypothetical protein ABHI18_001819 [Aspergillus niger]
MADQVTIYEATLACHRVFRDSAAVPTLQEWAENRLADLNLWASGAGALKVGKASLDARLSSNPDAKIFVVNLLGMLQAFVERCVETGTVESSHLAERTRNDFFLGTDGHTDTLDQAMQDVKSIIGQLSRITTSIRKAGTNARIQRADASYDPDHPQVKALKIHLQLLLLSRPTNNGTLRVLTSSHGVVLISPVDEAIVADSGSLTVIQQRLIEANLKRRNRFLYAQRHAIKLSGWDPTVSTSIQTPQKVPLPPGANPFARSTEEPELPKVYSTTTASDVQDPIQLPTRSSAQPTTTVISAISSRVTYPKPPPLKSDQNIFQCPCCCQTLPASVGKGSQWKKHLSRDILPYTCILEDCPRPERLYHTKDLWLSHMLTDHGGTSHWVCLACNGSSERRVFFEDSALTEHLEQKHSRGIKPRQIPMLASAWHRKQPPSIESCPLCALTDPDINVILNHVAEHLHAFSLRSLPWAQGDFECNGNSYGGYYEDHPYFDTGRSDDTRSVGSGSTESSEQMNLEDLPIMEPRKVLTENNQLTEDKIRCISEDPNEDMMAAFLAGIENQDPVTAPFQTPPSPARSDSGPPLTEEERIRLLDMHSVPSLSVPDPRYLDRDHSSAIGAPLPAPSDSESSTDEEDKHQVTLSHQPASSYPARPRSNSNDEPASPGFLSLSMAQEEFLSPVLSRYADLDGASITRAMKAEGAIRSGAEAAGFLLESGILARNITLPQGNAWPGELANFSLAICDEEGFQYSLAKLFGRCSRWVSMLLEHSNNAPCLSLGELTFEHIADRFRNAILDGSDVDGLLANPLFRKNTFISVTMTMVWEFIFTRYLFGLERPIRSAIKRLEKELAQSLPRKVVYRWRATTLHLLAQDIELKEQQEHDIEAISITIVDTLMAMLPVARPQEHPLRKELHGVLRSAVDLSFEMRTQLADYIMLPPLQPEFDSQGNLTSQIFFNSSLMHDQSGVYASDEEAEAKHAVVRLVLFPLVVKKGDDQGKGDEEVVVYPAQVVVAEKQSKRSAPETEIEAQARGSPGGTDYFAESNAQIAEDAAEVKEQRKAETFDLKDKLRATKRSRERLLQRKVELMAESQKRAYDVPGESQFGQNESIESPAKEAEESPSTSPGADTSFPGQNDAAVDNVFDEVEDIVVIF